MGPSSTLDLVRTPPALDVQELSEGKLLTFLPLGELTRLSGFFAPGLVRLLSATSRALLSASVTSSSTPPRALQTATLSRRRMNSSVLPSPTDKHRALFSPFPL